MFSMVPNYYQNYFTPEFFVDSFQATKKIVTDRVITDPVLNSAAHDYINAQTAFAKMLINNTMNISKYSLDHLVDYWIPKKQTHTEKENTNV